MLLESACHWLFCLKFLFKLITLCKKTKVGLFSEHYKFNLYSAISYKLSRDAKMSKREME